MTYPVGSPPSGAYVTGTVSDAQGQSEEGIRNQIRAGATNGFGTAQGLMWGPGGPLEAILMALTGFGSLFAAKQFSDEQIALMNDHTKQITELKEAYGQIILQGNSVVFTSNNTYYPTTGVVSIDVIIIGAGAGGGSGNYDFFNTGTMSGGGGGGGGETHVSVPASLLPRNPDGTFQGIPIIIGAGGMGAQSNGAVGAGGGNSGFSDLLTAGGGVGGAWGTGSGRAPGGVGMVPGGDGGLGGVGTPARAPTAGSPSVSPYDLHGGGGGGGGGGSAVSGQSTSPGLRGGSGGIAPGGVGGGMGSIGGNGTPPASIVATGGGGGGGGGYNGGRSGGNGAFPAGGGGGSGCDANGANKGGNGGNGILFVIERFS